MTDSFSLRSSEGACSSLGDEREKAKVLQKMSEYKDKLKELNEKHEKDVEKFLSVTRQSEIQRGVGNDNPMLVRIKNNFERLNRRHTQDREYYQVKLKECEERVKLIDNGVFEPSPSRSNVFSQGIRKAGANMKGVTETVMTAPMEFAQRLKSAFGSADNVSSPQRQPAGKLGQSTFFTNRRSADDDENYSTVESRNHTNVRGSSTLPPNLTLNGPEMNDLDSRPGSSNEEHVGQGYQTANSSIAVPTNSDEGIIQIPISTQSDLLPKINDYLKGVSQQIRYLDEKYEMLKNDVAHEIKFYADALEEERFKITKLEKILNDTIELHQAEFESLKEQNLMATRVDYQHNDRFKNLEEKIESVQNHMVRMENSITDTLDLKLSNPVWGHAALSGANILVELLKIVLFVVASALDLIRPLTGSRNRAGIVLVVILFLIFFGNHLPKLNPMTLFGGIKSSGEI